jgi:hypothetical protein
MKIADTLLRSCAPILGLGLCIGLSIGCRPKDGSIAANQEFSTNWIVMAWLPPLGADSQALLDPNRGPGSRLIRCSGDSTFAALDTALLRLSALRPVVVPEAAQLGVVRLMVDRRLGSVSEGPTILEETGWLFDDAIENTRRVLVRQVQRGPGANGREQRSRQLLAMGLAHRAELFRQLGEAYGQVERTDIGSVLTNSTYVISAHLSIATRCRDLARVIQAETAPEWTSLFGESAAIPKGGTWRSPFKAGGQPFVGGYPPELRCRLEAPLVQWIPDAPSTNRLALAPIPGGWLERLALEKRHLPEIRSAIAVTVGIWEARNRVIHRDGHPNSERDPNLQALLSEMARACESDLVDLIEMERRCTRISPTNATPELRLAYREIALAAKHGAKDLAKVVWSLSGKPSPALIGADGGTFDSSFGVADRPR